MLPWLRTLTWHVVSAPGSTEHRSGTSEAATPARGDPSGGRAGRAGPALGSRSDVGVSAP